MNLFTVAEAHNATGQAWHPLACIKMTGFSENISYGALAAPSDDVIGVTFTSVPSQANMQIAVLGIVTRVNTALWLPGTSLYCGANGYLSSTPDGPVLAQVLKQSAWDGVLYINCVTAASGGGGVNGGGTAQGLAYWTDSNTLAANPNITVSPIINGFELNGAEISGLNTVILLDNQIGGTPVITYPQAGNQDCIINYSVVRDGERRVGELTVTSTPTKVGFNDVFAETSPLGIEFDAELVGSDIVINYYSTPTGINSNFRYIFKRWGGL
jgi:hypothetical protein